MTCLDEYRFPNPCPVCGDDDDHAGRMKDTLEAARGFPVATVCPHPREPGHGTGCCCAGVSAAACRLRQVAALAPEPPLSSAQIRYLVRQCVTIVSPGETLVVRVPWTTTPAQLYEYQRVMDSAEGGKIPFKVLVVAGDELGVVQPPEGTPGAA